MSRAFTLTAIAAALLLAGCASAPDWKGAPPAQALQQADVPARLPSAAGAAEDTPAFLWTQVVQSPRLKEWVGLALVNNRDLRVAAANVQRARAQFDSTAAARLPTVGAGLGASRGPNGQGEQANTLTAGVQLASWEIDLFGRIANLSDAALAQWLATNQAQRATELSVVAGVLQGALALQADAELLALARQTVDSRTQTLKLVRLRESVGASSLLELQAQEGLVAQARATVAQLERQQAQDANALALLLGRPLPAEALAAPLASGPRLADDAWLAEVPAGLSSTALLRRPDVMQAESALRAADANIAAARAAFLPSITLTGQAGQASSALSGLFEGGHFAYTLAANAVLTVFDGGRRRAAIDQADAAERIALAQYERAVQSAFRETADALVALSTWREQLAALAQQREAARETTRLTDLKAAQGAASVLEQLEAQRGLYAAEQAWLQAQLAEQASRVTLYKALGR